MNLLKKANKYHRDKNYIKAYKLYTKAQYYYQFNSLSYNIQLCKKHIDTKKYNSILSIETQVAIKIAAPNLAKAVYWGDYYFALEIQKELEKLGYKVRIDCVDQWYTSKRLEDDVNIVLRGLKDFQTIQGQINIIWVISHPDLLTKEEINKYDFLFVASKYYTERLKKISKNDNIQYLPQASSFSSYRYKQDIADTIPETQILFIGNSRGEYRESVRWCVKKGLPLSIYGKGWEKFVPKKYIKGTFIDNELIPYYYRKANLVLNDHWEDMKKYGFVSNRVYDVLMAGGRLLTDYVDGIDDIKHSDLYIYKTKDEFYKKMLFILSKKHNRYFVSTENFLFSDRVSVMHKTIQYLLSKADFRKEQKGFN